MSTFSDRMYTNRKTNTQMFTPPNIVDEMLDALPEEVWNSETTFLDICCKSGIFLYKIYERLMKSPMVIKDFPNFDDRRKNILDKQIMGISPDNMCRMLSTRLLYGYVEPKSKTICLDDYTCMMTNKDKRFLNDALKKEFETMKFDVVIGNPPYNSGMDLDFVDLAYKLSANLVGMITPAKWQTAADDYSGCASKNISYKAFRETIVPHMKHVCYYPACKDVFDILQVDGITWYILDKQIHNTCTVENKCKYTTEFNSITVRDIRNRQSLFNVGNEIIQYLGNYTIFRFPYQYKLKKYQVWTNTQIPGGGLSTQVARRKTQFVGESHIEEETGLNIQHSNASICSFSSDIREECEYFMSWLNCKFTRFFVAINPSKLTGTITDDCFRFVPAPPSGKFDHIYTDEELYKSFNLPQKYIDVIEAIIKERT